MSSVIFSLKSTNNVLELILKLFPKSHFVIKYGLKTFTTSHLTTVSNHNKSNL